MKFPWWFLWPRHDEILDDTVTLFCTLPGCDYRETVMLDQIGELSERHRRERHPLPKLRVRKDPVTGRWEWGLWEGCLSHGYGLAPTQPAALAVGLAALETASMRNRT